MAKGLSGYLAPDGLYYACGYQEHAEKAVELIQKYELDKKTDYNLMAYEGDFIKFGCPPWAGEEGTEGCHVFLNMERSLTEEQRVWLDKNMEKLNQKQYRELKRMLWFMDKE